MGAMRFEIPRLSSVPFSWPHPGIRQGIVVPLPSRPFGDTFQRFAVRIIGFEVQFDRFAFRFTMDRFGNGDIERISAAVARVGGEVGVAHDACRSGSG